jgi:hypothetical protein
MTINSKLLERLSNLAVIAAALALIGFLAGRAWTEHGKNSNGDLTGKTIALATLTSAPASLNLVLALSTTCHFCAENAAFYRRLAELRQPGNVALITIFPQPESEGRAYLNDIRVISDLCTSHPLSKYGIYATPTLLLVDSNGRVQRAWTGALQDVQQKEVLELVGRTQNVGTTTGNSN